ncbi:MAG: ABC transporter permease subunit [Erysipelotrichaceae bacterium]
MNVFKHELKMLRTSTLVWTFSLAAIMVALMAMYPMFTQDVEAFRTLLQNYPDVFLKAFNLNPDTLFDPIGFFGFTLSYVLLFAAVHAMQLGLKCIGQESNLKTTDFLFSKPIARTHILLYKLAAILVSILLLDVMLWGVSWLSVSYFEPNIPWTVFLLLNLSILWIQLLFVGLGTLFGIVKRKVKPILSYNLVVVFSLYFLAVFDNVIDKELLRFFTPFKFFDPMHVIEAQGYDAALFACSLLITLGCFILSYVWIERIDFHAV